MASHKTKSTFMELLEALINCKLDSEEEPKEELCGQSDGFVSRGSKFDKPNNRKVLQHELLQKSKRNKMVQNVNLLRQLITEQKEVESLKSLAKILSEVTTNEEKFLFIRELNSGKQSYNTEFRSSFNDDNHSQSFFSENPPEILRSRSSVPQGSSDNMMMGILDDLNDIESILEELSVKNEEISVSEPAPPCLSSEPKQNDVKSTSKKKKFKNYILKKVKSKDKLGGTVPPLNIFDSLGLMSLDPASDSPCMTTPLPPISMDRYNPSELYVIQKGITYCRVLLHNFFQNKDHAIIRELKDRDLLNFVLNEDLGDSKSYLANLADKFPKSFDEILFILKGDKDTILRSQIFVLLAQRDFKLLNEFIQLLAKNRFELRELSKCCDESNVNGLTVSNIIEMDPVVENVQLKAKLRSFLNHHKSK